MWEWLTTAAKVIVAQLAAVVYAPKDISTWEYLDQIESAIEIACALDSMALPAAVMRAYLSEPSGER